MWYDEFDTDNIEDSSPRSSWGERWAKLRGLLKGRGKQLLLIAAIMIGSAAAELGGPLVLRHLIDVRVKQGTVSGMLIDAAAYIGLAVVLSVGFYFQVVVSSKLGLSLVAGLKHRLLKKMLHKSLGFFDQHTPGTLLARVESDTERIQVLFSEAAGAMIRNVVVLIGTFTVMLVTDWRITLFVLSVLAPLILIMPFFFKIVYRLHRKVRSSYAQLSGLLAELVKAIPVLQVFNATHWAGARMGRSNIDLFRKERKASFVDYSFWSIVSGGEIVLVAVVVWMAAGPKVESFMTLGTLVLFLEYARQIFFPLMTFGEQLGFINKAFASADRVFELLESEENEEQRGLSTNRIPRGWQTLRFKNVSFGYDDDSKALNEISFTIDHGEKIALVGLSGGGKTTITSLLMRFYEPQSGRILLDDHDILSFPLDTWRKRIGLVLQEINLFPGTVDENVRAFSSDITGDQVSVALSLVSADKFVGRLKGGRAAELSEGGENLSMGERQLLSMARAVVRDPDILILDEATSSVDAATEEEVQASMERAFAGRTVVVVAHRLSTLRNVDRILVIHRGELAEEGRHAELYTNGGIYRKLYDLQFGDGKEAMA